MASLEPTWKRGTNFVKLSSVFYTCTVAHKIIIKDKNKKTTKKSKLNRARVWIQLLSSKPVSCRFSVTLIRAMLDLKVCHGFTK